MFDIVNKNPQDNIHDYNNSSKEVQIYSIHVRLVAGGVQPGAPYSVMHYTSLESANFFLKKKRDAGLRPSVHCLPST